MGKAKSPRARAISAIDARGALLVYPINNRRLPLSLWSELHPRTPMRWEWDDEGDSKVADLWHLRMELSRSGRVVYSKWYQGRATFFSREVFVHLMAYLQTREAALVLGRESRMALECLEADSPLSTKQLKAACELEGRMFEAAYNRAMKPLWQRLLVVGFGEFEDSSFPSLGIGATKTLFEDLWLEAGEVSTAQAESFLYKKLTADNLFLKFANKIKSQMIGKEPSAAR